MRRSLAALVVVAGVLTGCTVPTTPPPPAPHPVSLTDALAMVRATDTTRAYLEYVDQSALNGKLPVSFAPLVDVGLGGLDASRLPDTSTRLVIGQAPDTMGIWLGDYDKAAPTSGAGAEHATAGSLTWAPTKAQLDLLTHPGRDTLAADETVAALARCLGDVEVAVFATRPSGVTFAVGVRLGEKGVAEVACARDTTRTAELLANATASQVAHELISNTVLVYQPEATVVALHWPRFDDGPAGDFYTMLRSGELDTVFGV